MVNNLHYRGWCPLLVKSAILTLGQSLPVYPEERTSTDHRGMSERCRYCCKCLFGMTTEKFLEPLMRLTSGDARDHIVSSKSITDLRGGAEK
jgi:hypothetical protein